MDRHRHISGRHRGHDEVTHSLRGSIPRCCDGSARRRCGERGGGHVRLWLRASSGPRSVLCHHSGTHAVGCALLAHPTPAGRPAQLSPGRHQARRAGEPAFRPVEWCERRGDVHRYGEDLGTPTRHCPIATVAAAELCRHTGRHLHPSGQLVESCHCRSLHGEDGQDAPPLRTVAAGVGHHRRRFVPGCVAAPFHSRARVARTVVRDHQRLYRRTPCAHRQ